MAKQKNNDKDLYGGLDLFNFMSSEVDKKIKDLEKRIINDNTTIEYNNNSRETDGLHRSEMGLFGREFDNGGIPTVETSSSRPQDSEIIELRASSGIEKMDMGVSDNQTTGRFNDSLFSISESSTDGRGDIGLTNSITTTSDGDYGYGDTRSEGNRPIQGSEASLRIYDIKEGEKLDFISNSEVIIGGAKDKYNKNIEAIKLLKTLENENRFAIFNEQEVLNSYTGWGGIPQAFDKENPTWSKEYSELKELLSTDEYESAKSSTLDSHYTPKIVIDSIYKSLKHFGLDKYNEPKEILEPSAGNGAFLSYVKNHFDNLNFTAIELDKTSSKLIKNLYPNQKVYNQGLEDYKSSKKFDAVIGNPPYGQKKIFDTSNPELSLLSIHNYFSARAIKELKDDGIMAFVTSSYFLDSKDHSLRDKISKQASFIGAIRLPNDTFKNKAGTEVTTDIIFFKKGFDKELHQDYNNLEVSSDTIDALKPITINEYFIKNPQNVLGQMQFVMSGIGETKQCVNVNNLDIEKELEKVISTLPSNIYKYHEIEKTEDKTLEIKNASNYHLELKNNSYFKHNNEIYKKLENRNDNRDIYCIKEDFTNPDKKRMDKYIDLRDSLNSLIKLEQTNISDNDERLLF
jgi:predicted RNA methylase